MLLLVAKTGNTKARLTWNVTSVYGHQQNIWKNGAIIEGWPGGVPFENPNALTRINELRRIDSAFTSGRAYVRQVDDAERVAGAACRLGDMRAGAGGAAAAVVEEPADVVRAEHVDQPRVVLRVRIRRAEGIAAGAEGAGPAGGGAGRCRSAAGRRGSGGRPGRRRPDRGRGEERGRAPGGA